MDFSTLCLSHLPCFGDCCPFFDLNIWNSSDQTMRQNAAMTSSIASSVKLGPTEDSCEISSIVEMMK